MTSHGDKQSAIWESLLEAEMNWLLWSDAAGKYASSDRILAAISAVFSSGTLFALLVSTPFVGKIIAALASVISICHATFFHAQRVKQVAGLALAWKSLTIDYRLLWSDVCQSDDIDDECWRRYREIAVRQKEIDESGFTFSDRRLRNAQRTVLRRRKLLEDDRPNEKGTRSITACAPYAQASEPTGPAAGGYS